MINRKFDIFIAPFTITPKRAKLILFSQPHFNAGQVVVVRSDNTTIKSHFDLRGKKVAATKGSTSEEAAQGLKADEVFALANQTLVNNYLLEGKCDAMLLDRPMALDEVKTHKGKLKIVGEPFTIEFYAYGLNKNDTELLMQLNQVVTILQEKGDWAEIFNRWFK